MSSSHALLSLIPFTTNVCAGDEIPVRVTLSVTGDAVNAAQGTVRFDPAQVRVTSVRTGGSVFRFWPVTPEVNQEAGEISFAGGLPTPGYAGGNGLLFTINVAPKVANADVRLWWGAEGVALTDDGRGTPAELSMQGVSLAVGDGSSAVCLAPRATPTPVTDTVSPEPFEVVVTKTDNGFQGQYFASFYAYDADSGIARYEVQENGAGWLAAQSPYRLIQQSGSMHFEVKAVDFAGNERISSVSLQLVGEHAYMLGPWWAWLIVAAAVAAALWRILSKRRQHGTQQVQPSTSESLEEIAARQRQERALHR